MTECNGFGFKSGRFKFVSDKLLIWILARAISNIFIFFYQLKLKWMKEKSKLIGIQTEMMSSFKCYNF